MAGKLKTSLLIIALLLSLGIGYWMFHLYQQQELWGYLPLFLFSSMWAFVMLLWEGRFSQHPQKLRLIGLATLSGILLALGFPTMPFTLLMFVGFVPLLMVEQAIANTRDAPNKKEVFRYSYHTFVVWNILTTYWVGNTAFVGGIVAIWANAFLMTIPFVLFHQTKKILNNKMAWLSFVAYWICFEFIHLRWEVSWTWLTLGNSFADTYSWVQWYEYTGVFGGTLWILLANILGLKIINTWLENKAVNKPDLLKFSGLILLPIIVSLVFYTSYIEKGQPAEVVVVQPNFEPHYEKFNAGTTKIFNTFYRLSKANLRTETDYLVFPETSFGGVDVDYALKGKAMRDLKKMVGEYPHLNLIMGVTAQKRFKKGEPHSRAVRTFVRGKDTIYWESINAALQMSSGNDDIPIYYKSKLVPGAEFLPYRELFFFLKPLVDKLGGSMSGLATQRERTVFKNAENEGIAPVICYESVYGEYTTQYVQKDANALFIVTNDGWWDNTAGHRQHLAFASLRAIETRRAIARSANTGISAFINQRGDILQPTKYEEEAAIRGTILLNDEITFYVKWGDLIGRLMLFITIILLLNTFVKTITGQPA